MNRRGPGSALRLLAAAFFALIALSTGAATLQAGAAGADRRVAADLETVHRAANEPGLESQYVAGVNGVRADAGLPPLAVDGELTAVARAWADQMAGANRISHNPNLAGQVSAPWLKIGENVGTGAEVGAVMNAFVNSPAHYENIVDGEYEYIGVGVTYGSDGRMYTAHVFMYLGNTAPPEPEPEPPPPPPAPEPEPEPVPEPAPTTATTVAPVTTTSIPAAGTDGGSSLELPPRAGFVNRIVAAVALAA